MAKLNMVVLEGPDGGGKTTLAELLCKTLGYEHVRSEGPEKQPGEIDERIERYFYEYGVRQNVLFDRHPCVSQLAYSLIHAQTAPNDRLIRRFYADRPLIIYCRPDPEKVTHTSTGAWDTPDYMKKVDESYSLLLEWYDAWAVGKAHYIYRIGEPVKPIEDLIKTWRKL
jgi:hypothetical protein